MKLDELFESAPISVYGITNEDVGRRGMLGGLGAALLGAKPATASVASTPSVVPSRRGSQGRAEPLCCVRPVGWHQLMFLKMMSH